MPILNEHNIFLFVAELGVIIFVARLMGEAAKRLGQPIIVGEMVAGIFLGSAVFGRFLPAWREALFPSTGPGPYLLQGISWLCILFLLLITGLEIDLKAYVQQGHKSILPSILAISVPFVGLYSATALLPDTFFSSTMHPGVGRLLMATALSVVSIPIIAKILLDFKILRSAVGLNILTSGVLSDIWGWAILGTIVSLIGTGTITIIGVLKPLITIVLYLGLTLTAGRVIVDKILNWIQPRTDDAAAILAFLFSLTLINGAIAHILGLHVVFGAFVAGIMAGESEKIDPHMRQTIQDIILGVFAPIFFVLVGMELNFTSQTNWGLILIFFILSCLWKILGAFAGGILSGIGKRNSMAVACGLMTQGTMGIIVALIGRELGAFPEETFSLIVMVCILTSLSIGPVLKLAIQSVRRPLANFFDKDHVFLDIDGESKMAVINSMVKLMHDRKLISSPKEIKESILEREALLTTAIGEGVALPHARIKDFANPMLCFFRLKNPVDFKSPDDVGVQLLFLELTNSDDDGVQLMLLSQVSRFLSKPQNRKKLLECSRAEEIHHILSFDESA